MTNFERALSKLTVSLDDVNDAAMELEDAVFETELNPDLTYLLYPIVHLSKQVELDTVVNKLKNIEDPVIQDCLVSFILRCQSSDTMQMAIDADDDY